jgi:hypothetical protein
LAVALRLRVADAGDELSPAKGRKSRVSEAAPDQLAKTFRGFMSELLTETAEPASPLVFFDGLRVARLVCATFRKARRHV